MQIVVNIFIALLSFLFLYISSLCFKKIWQKDYIRGVFRKNGDHVRDWEGNGDYLFYAISINLKRASPHATPEQACRIDNRFRFQTSNRTYGLDSKNLAVLRLSRRYKGVLEGTFGELMEIVNLVVRNRKVGCERLKEIYLTKKDRLKQPSLIFGYRGYTVYEWYIADGNPGFIKIDKEEKISEIMDRSYWHRKIFFHLLVALVFLFLFVISFTASFSNLNFF